MPIIFINSKLRAAKQDSVPYMMKGIHTHIPVECGVVDPYVDRYNHHHLWERVLLSTPELRINNDNGHAHRTPISGHAHTLPTNRHVHTTIEHPGHAQRTPPSGHAQKYHRTHIRCSNSLFPQT